MGRSQIHSLPSIGASTRRSELLLHKHLSPLTSALPPTPPPHHLDHRLSPPDSLVFISFLHLSPFITLPCRSVCVFLDHHSHTPRVLLVESLPLNAQSVQGRARCSFRPPSVLLFVWPGLLLPSPLARRLALQSTRLSGFPERRDKGHAAARAWPIAQGRGDFPP